MRRSSRIFRARQGRGKLEAENAIRKVVVAGTNAADWGLLGYEFTDPETGARICEGEGDEPIPVFQGIGIFARPVGSRGEAMMLHVGNQADHPILASVRDEDGRRAMVAEFGEPAAGEVAIFNGQGTARVLIKADGSIEISSPAKVKIGTKASVLREPGIKATTYRAAEADVMTELQVWISAMAALAAATTGPTAGQKLAVADSLIAFTAELLAFALGDASYKTTVLEAE